ncbi:MAG: choice-of-anchor I family protein, partial [Anaerolineales bacterium]|nr:choice-of-anchor I family protein [Anaerolineales bacterium]
MLFFKRVKFLKATSLLLVLLSFMLLPILLLSSYATSAAAQPQQETVTNSGTAYQETSIGLELRGVYTGTGSEIGAYHPGSKQLFNVTGGPAMEVLNISNPISPTLAYTVSIGAGGANSVAVYGDMVAVAVANADKQADGFVYFYEISGTFITSVTVGALPDMITFTPDGSKAVVANEGEPNADYTVDPEGSVSVIDVSGGMAAITQADVTPISFADFNVGGPRAGELPAAVRIFGPGATVAQDLEPEYIAVSSDSSTAWVTLQENNALATIDLDTNSVTAITALGFKDYSLLGNQLDASDHDDGINIDNWPVYGIYQPDAIAAYEVDGMTYLLTANEGDARDYDTFSEEVRVADLTLDTAVFTDTLILEENLGRLRVTNTLGDADMNGEYEALYAFGARSFSIWDAAGNLVFDSGDQVAHLTAAFSAATFNSQGAADSFDSRSDDKGAEPEGVTKGVV